MTNKLYKLKWRDEVVLKFMLGHDDLHKWHPTKYLIMIYLLFFGQPHKSYILTVIFNYAIY